MILLKSEFNTETDHDFDFGKNLPYKVLDLKNPEESYNIF